MRTGDIITDFILLTKLFAHFWHMNQIFLLQDFRRWCSSRFLYQSTSLHDHPARQSTRHASDCTFAGCSASITSVSLHPAALTFQDQIAQQTPWPFARQPDSGRTLKRLILPPDPAVRQRAKFFCSGLSTETASITISSMSTVMGRPQ